MPDTSEYKYRGYCDCSGPVDTGKPPVKRSTLLKAVPIEPRDPAEWFYQALLRGFGDGDNWRLR